MAANVLVIGRQAGQPPPGLPENRSGATYALVDDIDGVRAHLSDADVVFHYGDPRNALRDLWSESARLRWVHVGVVGVDWALFPALNDSDVVVTNSRGVFDVTMPEYALSLMLALVKELPRTIKDQAAQAWEHRLVEPLAGGRVVIVGAGSIARATARLLRTLGMEVILVGRSARDGGPGEGRIRAISDLHDLLPDADWLIGLVPLTSSTHGLIDTGELALLPDGARIVNIGRGPVIVEAALLDALRSGRIAGAALGRLRDRTITGGPSILDDAGHHRVAAHRWRCHRYARGPDAGVPGQSGALYRWAAAARHHRQATRFRALEMTASPSPGAMKPRG